MARCLQKAGFELIVCDNREANLAPFASAGAATSVRASDCARAEIVLVMVATDEQVCEVVLGSNGILAAAAGRTRLVAIMSTILPRTIAGIGEACRARGVRLVDAPVSGFPVLAETGKLTVMAGGDAADIEVVRPVFAAMAETILHTGPLGTGVTVKLLNNMVGLPALLLMPLAVSMARAAGLDPALVAEAMEKSSGRNFLSASWDRARAVARIFSASREASESTLDIARKDLEHALRLAESLGVEHHFLRSVVQGVSQAPAEEFHRDLRALE